jgi:hypothetical protein
MEETLPSSDLTMSRSLQQMSSPANAEEKLLINFSAQIQDNS